MATDSRMDYYDTTTFGRIMIKKKSKIKCKMYLIYDLNSFFDSYNLFILTEFLYITFMLVIVPKNKIRRKF